MSNFISIEPIVASCHDKEYDPEWWFPIEIGGSRTWSRTPDAMKARAICATCPMIKECRDYSLRFDAIHGIWAGLDRHERYNLQKKLRIEPESFSLSYRPYMEYVLRKATDNG
jgi:WhiB family redox-sensing transcriptional regulator